MSLKNELIESLKNMGFNSPTDVQKETIPVVLAGKDVAVRARTGTGKTGAFAIPLIQMLLEKHRSMGVLVLVPTRELALQVYDVMRKIGKPLNITSTTVYGGASINMQISALRNLPNIIVGTPGRVIDLIKRGALDLKGIKFLVLDEADTMLDMGFIEDVDYILNKTPQDKQTMLFSATFPKQIMSIVDKHLKADKVVLTIGKEEDITAAGISHFYAIADGVEKFASLIAYINQYQPAKAIIFTMTKMGADRLFSVLSDEGMDVTPLHGGMTQAKREHSLSNFKSGSRFMISTNIAARGLDIRDVTDIINFDAPDDPFVYIHRVGRSARMHKEGRAFTIFSSKQKGLIEDIKRTANIDMQYINLNTTGIDKSKFQKHTYYSGYQQHRGGYGNRMQRGGHRAGYGHEGSPHNQNRGWQSQNRPSYANPHRNFRRRNNRHGLWGNNQEQ